MKKPHSAWLDYFTTEARKHVKQVNQEPIDYGQTLYHSPRVDVSKASESRSISWIVTLFRGEYTVFLEKIINSKVQRKFAASFSWKNSAMQFALEMLLICSGHLKRNSRL